jgi:outer membrane receptor protein involved in Fe transport
MGTTRLAIFLVLGAALWAGEGDPPRGSGKAKAKPDAEAGATVTVTAESAPVEVGKTPNPVRILDAERLRAVQVRTLGELLPELVPGQALAWGGPGSVASLYLGGARAKDVAVLLDGIRISDAAGLSPNFGTIALAGVERAELLRGPASTLYGADAHGGVIALSSGAPAPDGLSGSAALGLGNRGLKQGQAAPSFGWGSGWARLNLGAREEQASIPADKAFRSAGGALSLGQKVGEDGLATLVYRNQFVATPIPFDAAYPEPYFAYTPVFDPKRESVLRDEQLIGSWRQILGTAWILEASMGQSLQQRLEPSSYGPERYQGRRNQGVATLKWTPAPTYQASLRLDRYDESARLKGDQATGTHLALATEHAVEFADAFRAVASLRWQRDGIDYLPEAAPALPTRTSSQAVWKAGLNWKRGNGRVYLSYGSAYNTPDLFSLTHNLAGGYGDLANEKSRGLQVGGDWISGPWQTRLEASRSWYSQVVNFVPLAGWNYRYENGTGLRIQGIEGSLAYQGAAWRLEAFARSQEARNESVPEAQRFRSSGATGRPFLTCGLNGHAMLGDLKLAGRWTWVGSSYQYFDALYGVEGTRTHLNDLALEAAWKLDSRWTIALRGEHLLQRNWTKEDWLADRILRRNDAYLAPVFPLPGPTLSLEARVGF